MGRIYTNLKNVPRIISWFTYISMTLLQSTISQYSIARGVLNAIVYGSVRTIFLGPKFHLKVAFLVLEFS